MPITITMPALSPTMTEGTLAKWHVKVGDAVAAGDVLAEIETDKATMEVEAVEEGKVARILVDEGTENVAVNAPIALLLEEEEDESALDDYKPEGGPPPSGDGGTAPAEETPPAKKESKAAPAPAAPMEVRPREEGRADADGRVFASPLARRMAAQAGIDVAQLSGSGPHGRIVKRDIDAALAAGPDARPASAAAAAPVARAPGSQQPLTEDYEEVRLNAMRKTIARRLTEAKQTVPHFYLSIDCAIDELLALRKRLNEKAEEKISVNDFVVRAAALALARHPDINAQWTDGAILRHRPIDVSVAVAIEGGLITPIIRNTDRKGLATIAAEMKDLAGRAREGKLAPEEYQGGTFSVSNLGMFGIEEFIAVINPPQAAIVAVGAGVQRPVVRDGAVAIATMMNLTLSADHRVFGGAEGAAFLATLRRLIEDPITMLL